MKSLALSSILLTLSSIHQAIEEAIVSNRAVQHELSQKGLSLRRASEPTDWDRMLGLLATEQDIGNHDEKGDVDDDLSTNLSLAIPRHFGITIRNNKEGSEICGLLSFYMAYSSWDGRILYVDRLVSPEMDDATEILLLRTLAAIALKLDCVRLTWRVRISDVFHFVLVGVSNCLTFQLLYSIFD